MSSSWTEQKDIRKFGLIALVFFGALFSLALWRDKTIPMYLFGVLALLGLGFVVIPGPMRPVHAGWLKAAHAIGRAVTTAVLTLAYYLVITPSALLKRIFGGKPISCRIDRDASSYWVAREEPVQTKERFHKRF
ncbi:MAG: hypothetical protein ACQET7_15080 [Thermodesulfobacteriota bacterium]